MPPRASHLPSHSERGVLQKLLGGRELPVTKLYPAGAQVIKTMVAKDWVRGSSDHLYRITPAGETTMRAKLPVGRPVELGLKKR
jgi:hypothetical protein